MKTVRNYRQRVLYVVLFVILVPCIYLTSIRLASPVSATMIGRKEVVLDFTKPDEIKKSAKWSPVDKLSLFPDGLGWEGPENHSRDMWIESVPVAVGWSWRPTRTVSVKGEVLPVKIVSRAGQLYARYSPDMKNWSSWQCLQRRASQSKQYPDPWFSCMLRVPYRESKPYRELLRQYWRLDVPWSSDEEAAVRWILQSDPQFFENCMPFIGYVQFLFEISLRGGQKIEKIEFELNYGAGGRASIPRDKSIQKKHRGPWRFKAH